MMSESLQCGTHAREEAWYRLDPDFGREMWDPRARGGLVGRGVRPRLLGVGPTRARRPGK